MPRATSLVAVSSLLCSLTALGGTAPSAAAEPCTDDGANLVVSRVGDGSAALTSAGTATFLDEYTRTGTLVRTIALPTSASGEDRPLVSSGTATSSLGLARSADGRFLTLAGYDAAPGTASVTSSTSAAVNRVVARVDAGGTVDTSTRLSDAFSGDNVRSAVTDDGSRFWVGGTGSPGGVRLAALGATTSTSISAAPSNVRWVTVQAGRLYATSGSSPFIGVNQIGTEIPTTGPQTATKVIDTTNAGANGSSPYGLVLLDRDPAVPGADTAYVADDQGSGAGGLRKYSFDGTAWTAQGRIAATLRGVTGVGDATSATLWVTTSTNTVQTLTDTAASAAPVTGTLSTIVTGAVNTAIRGIALAPTTGTCGPTAPAITDEPDDATVASGGTATLTVAAGGTEPLGYQWYRGASGDTSDPVSGAIGPSYTTPPLLATTSYWVRVTNDVATADSRTATVTVGGADDTPPTITEPGPLADADGDPSGPTATVTVGDAETPVGSLVVTATSSNQGVLPDSGIGITGTGADRVLSFDPAGVGYATVTIRVTDGGSRFAEATLSYAASAPAEMPSTTRFHHGAADASTAIDAGDGYSFVANDEDQTIRLYDTTTSGPPVAAFDFTAVLGLIDLSGGVPREVDIEASARVGNRIHWLASHGNSSSGSSRPNRQRLFTTDVTGTGAGATLSFVGSYQDLRADLIAWDQGNGHGLGADHYGLAASAATGTAPEAADASSTPPGQGRGFNIEGLEVAADGTTGYVAFRAPNVPLPQRPNALVVPVTNLTSLTTSGGPATFGAPIEWDLDLGGVRELRRNAANQYLIISGRAAGGDPSGQALWTWDGNPASAPVRRVTDLTVADGGGVGQGSYEAIASLPDMLTATSPVRLFADSGDTVWYGDGVIAKELPLPGHRKAASSVFALGGVPARIHDIQGAGHVSPLAAPVITDPGAAVAGVPGVVTATRSNGFFLEDPEPDTDPATSEAIFVFTGSTRPAAVAVGNLVSVSGTVTEFRPGCDAGCAPSASAIDNLTITQLESATVTLVSTGNPLPSTTVGGPGAQRTPPVTVVEDDAVGGDVEAGGTFDPATDGLDFFESLEAMQVRIDRPEAVSRRTSFSAASHELVVVPGDLAAAGPRSPRGGIVLAGYDDRNPERIFLADGIRLNGLGALPAADVGAAFTDDVTGVMFYDFGNYVMLPSTALPPLEDGGLEREVTPLTGGGPGELTVGTFNVENLDAAEPQVKFDALAAQIVLNMGAPDVVVVQEIQDDDGQAAGGVSAELTWNRLIQAVAAQPGGPAYQFRQIDPVDNSDGGAPNGNIRQGFLFRTDRGVAFVDRPGATATTPTSVQVVDGEPRLSLSPGRIDPTNNAFASSRKPLAGEFTFAGRTVFVVGNHWNSKGGDDADFGRFQPPVRSSEAQRQQQAQVVTAFVEQIQGADPDAAIIVAGDLNDFVFSTPVTTLTDAGYTSLVTTLPVGERYGYVFDGNSQVLDHIVVSDNLVPWAEYDAVHVNAEFEDQQSDHDPSVARFRFFRPSRPGVVRAKTEWSLGQSLATGTPTTNFSLGAQPQVPLMGDWDGNGSRTPGVYKAGTFSLYDSVPPGPTPDVSFAFGDRRGFPVAGDFDGDGRDDVAVYRSGTWQIRLSGDGATSVVTGFGTGSWPDTVPVAGDWDGDGVDGIGFYRAGTWTLRATTTGGTLDPFTYGPGRNPYPVVGDWDGDGVDTVGVKARKGSTWQLNDANDSSPPELTFDLGASTDLPVTW